MTDITEQQRALEKRIAFLEKLPIPAKYVVNVKEYGATGDGTTDDTAAIQAAWAALPAGGYGVLEFTPDSTFLISDTLDFSGKNFITIRGNRAVIQTKAGVDFSNKAMVDFAGCAYGSIYDLRIEGTLVADIPSVGLLLGRTNANSSGGQAFFNILVSGYFSFAAYYNVGSEASSFYSCQFSNYEDGGHAAYISNDDVESLLDLGAGQLVGTYVGCIFWCLGDTAASNIYLCGAVSDHLFIGCYGYISPGGYFVYTCDGTGSNGMNNNRFVSIRIEAGNVDHDDSRIWYQNNATGSCGNFLFDTVQFAGPAVDAPDYFYDINKTISNCVLNIVYNAYGKGLLLNSTATVVDCVFRGRAENQVTIESGITFARNRFEWMGEHYPFDATPAGMNLIQYCHAQILNPTMRTFTTDDATPSVAGGTLFITDNDNPTTITMFDNGFVGQEITVLFGDANTTINFYPGSTYLFGNGGVDWSPATTDCLKAVCTGADQWHCWIIEAA